MVSKQSASQPSLQFKLCCPQLPFFSDADLGPAIQMYWHNVLMTYGCKIHIQLILVQRTDVCVWLVLRKTKTCQQMWSLHLLSQEMLMKIFMDSATQLPSWLQLRKYHTLWQILNYFPLLIKRRLFLLWIWNTYHVFLTFFIIFFIMRVFLSFMSI